MVFLATGIPTKRVTELSRLCDRSTRSLLKSMCEEDIGSLLTIKRGPRQKGKISGVKAEKSELILLFMGASHFVMGCDFLGYIYGKVRRFVLTFSGRRCYNVLGVIDYVTKKVLIVTNESYLTATKGCEMLRKIFTEYAGKAVHLVLDNACYQKCRAVMELAARLGIELEYAPI